MYLLWLLRGIETTSIPCGICYFDILGRLLYLLSAVVAAIVLIVAGDFKYKERNKDNSENNGIIF
jgi:hypothetical protein